METEQERQTRGEGRESKANGRWGRLIQKEKVDRVREINIKQVPCTPIPTRDRLFLSGSLK